MSHPKRKKEKVKATRWNQRNFITEVLIPSFFIRRRGVQNRPVFPRLQSGQIAITWIGHASFLIQTPRHNILIDPNWANWLIVIRRLKRAGLAIRDLPNIDLVLITHAHFDHLNRRSLAAVAARQPIVVPSGVSNLVFDLGFELVQEMDWWDEWHYDGLKITFTPAKHWGARVLHDRHRGYGGFVIEFEGRRIYHCGDSAYFSGFREIGRRLSPEIALLPIGAYEPPSFRDVHMGPEQAVQAFHELKSKTFVPMHYGTYRLSYEPMHEPAQRLLLAGSKAGLLQNIRFLVEGMPQVF
ncbi:MAG: MBL fold metallo-hydrolase [Methylacidiphilales bacterium]|nr:MBL fold metallo-hydrolase [Candidatus Methylacidiphilales bacterium]